MHDAKIISIIVGKLITDCKCTRSMCEFTDVIMLQEHWLPPFDLHKLYNISPDFTSFASSAMSQAVKCDILKGRPFGGVAILV